MCRTPLESSTLLSAYAHSSLLVLGTLESSTPGGDNTADGSHGEVE